MLTIFWNDGPSKGTTDLIPEKWFSKKRFTRHQQHKILYPPYAPAVGFLRL